MERLKSNPLYLKITLLSVCLVESAMNGITGNIPEMAKDFPFVPLYMVELLTTVPALFAMGGVMTGKYAAHRIGYKRTLLLGIALCALSGSLPFFIKNFYLIFATRCVFGWGNGFIISTLLSLIIYVFEGNERSTMIGLQGSINGLGSALSAYIGGQLLTFGWQRSFAIYFVGFLIFPLVLFIVPQVKTIKMPNSASERSTSDAGGSYAGLAFCAVLLFVSVLLLSLFTVKASTLITTYQYGTSTDGSVAIAIISLGAVLSGAFFGRLHKKWRGLDLVFYYAVSAAGFFITAASSSLLLIFVGAFLTGIGYMGYIPFLQDRVSKRHSRLGETATAVILIAQSMGSFASPYLGKFLQAVTTDLKGQFITVGLLYILLMAIALILFIKDRKTADSCPV